MGSAIVLREKYNRPNKKLPKFPKPPLKNCTPSYDKIMECLERLGSKRADEIKRILNEAGPEDSRRKAADEIFNTPGALITLEKIMLEEKDYDDKIAAAVFTELFRHKSGVELTKRQKILYELTLYNKEELVRDLEVFEKEGGRALVDIIMSRSNNQAQFAAAMFLENAKLSPDDMERLGRLAFVEGADEDVVFLISRLLENEDNLSVLVPHLISRINEDETVENIITGIGKPMFFPLVGMLYRSEQPEKIIRMLGEIKDPRAVRVLEKFENSPLYDSSLDGFMADAMSKLESS